MTKRRKTIIGLAGLAVVAVLGAAIWFLLIRDDGPPAATSATAIEAAQQRQGSTPTTGPKQSPLDGAWAVDNTFGNDTYPYEASSYVGYRVVEELASVGAFTAVGRTTTVTGSLTIEGTQITAVFVDADLTRLKSDTTARDEIIRSQALETATYTNATFTLTQPIEFTDFPADEETIAVSATGDLSLHGVTRKITIELEATLIGDDTIAVIGTTRIDFADYNIEPPSAAIVLSIEDRGQLEFQLFFTR